MSEQTHRVIDGTKLCWRQKGTGKHSIFSPKPELKDTSSLAMGVFLEVFAAASSIKEKIFLETFFGQ